jgi:hypothetical protein
MREVFAVLQRFLTTVHRVDKAALLIEISRYNLPYQVIGISPLLSSGLYKSRFEFGCEYYFHEIESTAKPVSRQGNGRNTHENQTSLSDLAEAQ